MKNYYKPGQELDVVAPVAMTAGVMYQIGTLIGISAGTYAIGEKGILTLCGAYKLPNPDGTAFAQGVLADWDTANGKLVATTTGDHAAGTVMQASNGTDDVIVLLPLGPYAFNGM